MADYKVTDQELIVVANAIKTLFTTNINSEPKYKWSTDYVTKLQNIKNSLDACINKIKELNSNSKIYISNQDGYTLNTLTTKIKLVVNDLKDIIIEKNNLEQELSEVQEILNNLENLTDSINILLDENSTEEEKESAQEILDELVDSGLEKEEEEQTIAEQLAGSIFDLLDLKEQLEATVAEYESGDYSIIEITSKVNGQAILNEIVSLENARRQKTTTNLPVGANEVIVRNLPSQLEPGIYYRLLGENNLWYYAGDEFVIYTSKVLYDKRYSFICAALKNGTLQQGTFFYREDGGGGVNFYTTTIPNTNAYLEAGTKLIRVVLDEYNQEES